MDRDDSNDRTTAVVIAATVIIATVALLALAGLGGVSCAAGGENAGGSEGEMTGAAVSATSVTNSINYQGRLTDSSGSPLTGTYTMTFRRYNVSTRGTALATDKHNAEVTDGLFNTGIDFDQSYFDGRALWLGVAVGADSEMTPGQELRLVPYALSLVPGAVIDGSVSGPVLKVNTDSVDSYGVYAYTTGYDSEGFYAETTGKDSPAVYGYSVQDVGVYGKSDSGFAGYFDGKVHVSDNVGIGTTSPSAKLHVMQASNVYWAAYIYNAGGDGDIDR